MSKQGLEKLIVSPAIWPGKNLIVQPGDLSTFASQGDGVYGYQIPSIEPIKNDPPQEESGGLVYFGNGIKGGDFKGFLGMIGVRAGDKRYAAFIQESSNPLEDRYFKQMRLVSRFGLRFMFQAIDNEEYDSFKEQELSAEEALWSFIEMEKEKCGTSFWQNRIAGSFGGDGDFAREELSFGFMLENQYNQIYRIWSRAWLVTK